MVSAYSRPCTSTNVTFCSSPRLDNTRNSFSFSEGNSNKHVILSPEIRLPVTILPNYKNDGDLFFLFTQLVVHSVLPCWTSVIWVYLCNIYVNKLNRTLSLSLSLSLALSLSRSLYLSLFLSFSLSLSLSRSLYIYIYKYIYIFSDLKINNHSYLK